MLEKNLKVLSAYKNNNTEEKDKVLKEIISTPTKELFDQKEFNFSDAELKFNVVKRSDISITKTELIDSSFNYFKQYYDVIIPEEYKELKAEVEKLPLEYIPTIYLNKDTFIDIFAYHIFHFIKETKHILANIDNKKRYFHSTFKTNVIEKQIKAMEEIKTNTFLFPKTEFDQNILKSKEKLLEYAYEHYNILFALYAFFSYYNMEGAYNDKIVEKTINDFQNTLNAINITKKDAIKSLAILLFNISDKLLPPHENELFVENTLRIFFKNEIEEINQNKDVDTYYLDTFKVDTKEFRKRVYISCIFDNIPIYGINRQNKYFFYKNLTRKEFMRMYFEGLKDTEPDQDIPITKSTYKVIQQMFEKPHGLMYKRQYPEFFTMENPSTLDITVSFFELMKKTAPDNLR